MRLCEDLGHFCTEFNKLFHYFHVSKHSKQIPKQEIYSNLSLGLLVHALCGRFSKNQGTSAFLNVHTSKRRISRMLCTIYIKCGWLYRRHCCSNNLKMKPFSHTTRYGAELTDFSIVWRFSKHGSATKAHITETERAADF